MVVVVVMVVMVVVTLMVILAVLLVIMVVVTTFRDQIVGGKQNQSINHSIYKCFFVTRLVTHPPCAPCTL